MSRPIDHGRRRLLGAAALSIAAAEFARIGVAQAQSGRLAPIRPGTNTSLGLTHVSTGVYTGDITVTQDGIWKYASLSTGAAAGAGPSDGPGEFLVRSVS